MKILIYGGNGWIGNQFITHLNTKKISYTLANVRVNPNNEQLVKTEIIESNCTHVISMLGRTHGNGCSTIDYLESKDKLKENINDNLYSPLTLGIICNQLDIHYSYLGTGCIYNGEDIDEEMNCNFFGSSYSVVKSYTDKLIRHFNVLNLRIRMPISSMPNSRNFITKIVNYKKICSITNSMTILDDFIPIILDMMNNKYTGTFNCVNPVPLSHNEVLEIYRNVVDPDFKWENFTLEEQDSILKAGRSNNVLNTKKLEDLYYIPSMLESLPVILKKYKRELEKL